MPKIEKFRGEFGWLSNFANAPVTLDGVKYPTVENAFQAAKLNWEERGPYAECSPVEAKRKSKEAKARPNFEKEQVQIMLSLVRQKFEIPWLREKLLATGKREIVEGNWWHDTFWGVCNGVGANNLGKIIMQVRDEIAPPPADPPKRGVMQTGFENIIESLKIEIEDRDAIIRDLESTIRTLTLDRESLRGGLQVRKESASHHEMLRLAIEGMLDVWPGMAILGLSKDNEETIKAYKFAVEILDLTKGDSF